MRRGSFSMLSGQLSQEPMIVVEESGGTDEEDFKSNRSTPRHSLDIDSPMNPYLLSPWRDPRETRKHSLPTPACTGITASQVRRLSERGGEGSGPTPREAAFLATLSQAPAPQPGGRRHSVVTISRVPPMLFGRGRRESIAAFPTAGGIPSVNIKANRRESIAAMGGPPSTEHRGSVHNLQLDIMDDIVAARKVRMKLWNTSSERVCEVQAMDETPGASSPMRYTHTRGEGPRRYSDFVGSTLSTIPARRRASEQPPISPAISPQPSTSTKVPMGIVCTNTDLISILSSLTSSATEINQHDEPTPKASCLKQSSSIEQRRNRLKNSRSNSFDVSILHGVNHSDISTNSKNIGPSSWFIKRHQPMANKKEEKDNPIKRTVVTFANEKLNVAAVGQARNETTKEKPLKDTKPNKQTGEAQHKVVWDGSGSVVDAQVLGSAIEVFLRRTGGSESSTPSPSSGGSSPSKGAVPKVPPRNPPKKTGDKSSSSTTEGTWYSGKPDEEESTDTCDSSLCSTLKDLFVK